VPLECFSTITHATNPASLDLEILLVEQHAFGAIPGVHNAFKQWITVYRALQLEYGKAFLMLIIILV
jgi:hypothetical protein